MIIGTYGEQTSWDEITRECGSHNRFKKKLLEPKCQQTNAGTEKIEQMDYECIHLIVRLKRNQMLIKP